MSYFEQVSDYVISNKCNVSFIVHKVFCYCNYTDIYKVEDFEPLFEVEGSTMDIANKYGWAPAIFHEIYNLRDYYKEREKRIQAYARGFLEAWCKAVRLALILPIIGLFLRFFYDYIIIFVYRS